MELKELYGALVEFRNLTASYHSNPGKMPIHKLWKRVDLAEQLSPFTGIDPSLERIDVICDFLYARLYN